MKRTAILIGTISTLLTFGTAAQASDWQRDRVSQASQQREDRAHADGSYRRAYEKRRAAERAEERRERRHRAIVSRNSQERERQNHRDGTYRAAYERRN